MVSSILNYMFTEDVVRSMGDYYSMVYSWSAFALTVLFALFALGFCWLLLFSIYRSFR